MTKKKNKNKARSAQGVPVGFKFTKQFSVGAADAVDDQKYLSESFFDNGELDVVKDTSDPKFILVGRTGSGKTALIEKLDKDFDRVIKIYPNDLALDYLADSTLLKSFTEMGIKLDPFYNLLWRHIFITEIFKQHFNLTTETTRQTFFDRVASFIVGDRGKKDALNYLMDWGEQFWLGTEERVKEVTRTVEKEFNTSFSADAKAKINNVDFGGGASRNGKNKFSEAEKAEIIQNTREVVSRVQMRKINEIIKLIDEEILRDKQKRYYIAIDKLDENWTNDSLRYQVVRALIEAARDFNSKVRNVKIIIALREDLIERVFRHTQDAGFQEEKFHSLFIELKWSQSDLENLLALRVKQMAKEKYPSKPLSLRDFLPAKILGLDSVEYLVSRTLLRPRDLISFFNECIKEGSGKSKFTAEDIIKAELNYSDSRLKALADEWSVDYPNLIHLVTFMKKYPAGFKVEEIVSRFRVSSLDFITRKIDREDFIFSTINEKFNDPEIEPLINECLRILFKVGIIGIKNSSYLGVHWSYKKEGYIGSEISADTYYYLHPCVWKILGVQPIKPQN